MTESSQRETEESERLTPLPHTAQNRCFGCGEANRCGTASGVSAGRGRDGGLPCDRSGYDLKGRLGLLHGGIIATLLDEAMSKAVRAQRADGDDAADGGRISAAGSVGGGDPD